MAARAIASALYPWKALMVKVPRAVADVFDDNQTAMIKTREQAIDKAEFDMFYELFVRLEWFMKPYRVIAFLNALKEVSGLKH